MATLGFEWGPLDPTQNLRDSAWEIDLTAPFKILIDGQAWYDSDHFEVAEFACMIKGWALPQHADVEIDFVFEGLDYDEPPFSIVHTENGWVPKSEFQEFECNDPVPDKEFRQTVGTFSEAVRVEVIRVFGGKYPWIADKLGRPGWGIYGD